ncbi:MAG: Ig-like domain repeat protein, partial [Methanococcaceae archaeon]
MNKKSHFLSIILILILPVCIITGCKENDDNNPNTGAAPSITLSLSEMIAAPGSSVTTSITIDAPVGLKKLVIYKNGASIQEVPYNYEKTATHNFNYNIESNASVGSVITFSFEAIDSLDRKSDLKNFVISVTENPQKEIIQVTADISMNTTWTANKIWRINNTVKVKDGAILTIEPGTVIFGASDTQGTLIIQRGAKIMAEGSSSSPIVFTSDKAPGLRSAGDWAGIIICGKAPNNQGNNISFEGLTNELYGGTIPNDNSGILKYVRIEFAGKVIENNKEVNSLTLASVGSETTISNVQVSYGLDDSFEFFGGAVNAKYLISYKAKDDDFDCDYGHNGFIQFALALRDANTADIFYSNGIEVDNDGAGTSAPPFTQTVFANISVIGGKYTADNTVHL